MTLGQAQIPDAAERTVSADTVIIAPGAEPNRGLVAALGGNVGEVRNTRQSVHGGAGGARLE